MVRPVLHEELFPLASFEPEVFRMEEMAVLVNKLV
jgi:hypothetical protein